MSTPRRGLRLVPLFASSLLLLHCGGPSRAVDASLDAVSTSDTATDVGSTDAGAAQDASSIDAVADTGTDAGPRDTGHDVGPPDEIHRDGGALTLTYVIDQLSIDATDTASVPHHGMNLDGLFSSATSPGGCFHADFFAVDDSDQNCPSTDATGACTGTPGCLMSSAACFGGVDNQMPTVVNEIMTAANYDIRTALTTEIDASQLVLLMRLTDVDDLTNDPLVYVQLYNGFPTFSTGCTSVDPDREYQVAQASLRPGGTTLNDAAFQATGAIVAGRLTFAAPDDTTLLGLPVPVSPTITSTFHFHGLQMRMDLTDTTGTRGDVGGWVLGREVADSLTAAQPGFGTIIESVVRSLIDIRVSGTCADLSTTPATYGGISAGFAVSAVRASLNAAAPIATSAMPGVCGTF